MSKRIRKMVFATLLATAFLYIFLPIPIGGQRGVYNTITGLYWCSDAESCLHERGHQMDAQLGWISHTSEWEVALSNYVLEMYSEGTPTPYTWLIMGRVIEYQGAFHQLITDEQSELYADIYALSNGNREEMPDTLEPFYLWKNAND